MATVTRAPGVPGAFSLGPYSDEDGNMTTLPDPRSRTMSPANESGPASPSLHPDLNSEVAALSNKLINAINHQTTLDDTLAATRHELELSKERVRQLEQENKEHADLLASGVMIKKSVADAELAKLTASLIEERRQRAELDKEKKHIEQELENLTTALFEEANKMVITAREEAQKEHDIVQRKNDQLKAQVADTESLLRSQQEQLAELKRVMEQMTLEREDQTNPTAPSTPGLSKFDSIEGLEKEVDGVHSTLIPDPVSPTYPTSFTHLLHTVLRTDLSVYDDFTSLLRMSKNLPVSSRVSSGSYGSIGLGLSLGGYSSSQAAPTNGSTSSLSTAGTHGSSPATTPTTPASTVSTTSSNGPNALTPLKETKFYKRVLAEDIEPTLRLDTAPGLSWLARRTVLNAVCEGTLVVEPMPSAAKHYTFACSLCGETRKDPAHVRSHRFKTNENDNAQRYPLCKYCLGRVRSTCDYLGFLRILKEGHWRCDDEESERAAWEESVRLREQMFWCRIGGGVIPAHPGHSEPARSPRISEDERKEQEAKLSEELERTGEIRPKDVTPVTKKSPIDISKRSSVASRQSKISTKDDTAAEKASEEDVAAPPAGEDGNNVAEERDRRDGTRDSTQSASSLNVDGEKASVKRLSITIPRPIE